MYVRKSRRCPNANTHHSNLFFLEDPHTPSFTGLSSRAPDPLVILMSAAKKDLRLNEEFQGPDLRHRSHSTPAAILTTSCHFDRSPKGEVEKSAVASPPRAHQFPIAHASGAIQIRRSFSPPTRFHAERKRSICGCSCHSSRGLVFHLHYGNAQPYPQLAASRPREQENSSGLALTVRVQSPEFFMGGVLGDQVGRVLRVTRESVCRIRFWANTPANSNTKPFGCPDGRVKARYSRK